ncbi:MAG TPA: ribosome recycling factor [Polyangiaceae bacterium LLY-WYZ-15_(1-7)]|nr:ribosome recycling factor [Myxococcales bacterium]MAT28348.1 ribosome recycling factor [Sandaracinus sp.]HJK89518.1 ribosome recycling factor [Polyangiaceae bacterium LLY-WYZ-15_(1-7)]MBJ72816.1 ribosome recycling factor [Sandaracinus sp.]HJL03163.1 ribosome recycling factor [Polyangiaceae bacterium LLY-WYZ-15_(1-7)]
MIQETLDELKTAISKAHDSLKRELAKVRTGRANPDILDSVRVEYYGSMTPLKQLASISVPEPRMIMLKPFDRSSIQAIERAINSAQLGLNPSNDGELIRIPMPPLTEERRKDLVKVARAKGEDCKVAIRKARHDAKDMLDALEKDGEVGADEADRGRKSMEEIVKGGSDEVDRLVSDKETDIMEV